MWAVATIACSGTEPKVGSIGAILSRDRVDGAVYVRDVPGARAASNAGLLAGDRVKMIDGVLADELNVSEIKHQLRGHIGSTVTLTVLRGQQVIEVTVEREPLKGPTSFQTRRERIDP